LFCRCVDVRHAFLPPFSGKIKAQAIPGPRRMQRKITCSDEAGATENASTNTAHAYHARCGFHHTPAFDSDFVHGSILFLLTYYVNRLYKKCTHA
ncbi:MAG: hypothetical protein IKN28_03930, partial [Firmicutes bacterium]|nr:hypothetical protein [Bacillota bacterium]